MSKCTVRPYQPQDRPALVHMFESFADYFTHIDPMKRTRKGPDYGNWSMDFLLERTKKDGLILVAELNNKVVGFISGRLEKQTPEELMEVKPTKYGKVLEFFVDEQYRGQGIGDQLMTAITAFFKEHGHEMISLSCFAPNMIARNFYKKLGFQEWTVDLMKEI